MKEAVQEIFLLCLFMLGLTFSMLFGGGLAVVILMGLFGA